MTLHQHRTGAEVRIRGRDSLGTPVFEFDEAPRSRNPRSGRSNASSSITPFVISKILQKQKVCKVGRAGCVVHPSGVIRTTDKQGAFRLVAVCANCRRALDGGEAPR